MHRSSQTKAQQSHHLKNLAEIIWIPYQVLSLLTSKTTCFIFPAPFTTLENTIYAQDKLIYRYMKYYPKQTRSCKTFIGFIQRVLHNYLKAPCAKYQSLPPSPVPYYFLTFLHTNVFLLYYDIPLKSCPRTCLVPTLLDGREHFFQNLLQHQAQVQIHALKASKPTHSSLLLSVTN